MAEINAEGNIQAHCPSCNGALSTFSWRSTGTSNHHGAIYKNSGQGVADMYDEQRLFRCEGCGRGALANILRIGHQYPGKLTLISFYPECFDRLTLVKDVPEGIKSEFKEAEDCLSAGCIRAAAGMFRSVLDKTLRANGYKTDKNISLAKQIDMACADKVLTDARKIKAHEDIRTLGNDVLHDEWQMIPKEDVLVARHYCQRILEDFYDDRPVILGLLRKAGRVPDEDRQKNVE